MQVQKAEIRQGPPECTAPPSPTSAQDGASSPSEFRSAQYPLSDHLSHASSQPKEPRMVVTVYETQTPDGWDGIGGLTTLARSTITQSTQQTVSTSSTASSETSTVDTSTVPTATSVGTTSIGQAEVTSSPGTTSPSSAVTSSSGTSQSSAPTTAISHSSAQLSAGAISGIAVGSIAVIILLATCLLFTFGPRLRRARSRSQTEIAKPKDKEEGEKGTLTIYPGGPKEEVEKGIVVDYPAGPMAEDDEEKGLVANYPCGQDEKAMLEDAGYTKNTEWLHDGEKYELEGSMPWDDGWRAIAVRSVAKPGATACVFELEAETVTREPHELPA